jgi:hypothetical protein
MRYDGAPGHQRHQKSRFVAWSRQYPDNRDLSPGRPDSQAGSPLCYDSAKPASRNVQPIGPPDRPSKVYKIMRSGLCPSANAGGRVATGTAHNHMLCISGRLGLTWEFALLYDFNIEVIDMPLSGEKGLLFFLSLGISGGSMPLFN